MKKTLLAFVLVALHYTMVAQVSLQPGLPAASMIQKSQLWNVLVVNSTSSVYDCRLVLVLSDRLTGQEVLTATSTPFSLGAGAKQFNATVLSPIQYNYLTSTVDNSLQGLIPVGSYTACYTVTTLALKTSILAEECIQFDAEPLSPPMLITPADSSELDMAPGQFTWMPPTPAAMFSGLQYEILVTEIREGQNAHQALQENLPVHSDGAILTNFLNYPSSATGLEKDKWYAWQVIARDNRNYAGQSEVWVFKVKKEAPPATTPESLVYLLLQDDVTGTYSITTDKLRIKYFSPDPDYETSVIFSDAKGNILKQVTQKIRQGDNYLDFDIRKNFQQGIPYKVIITDTGNKHHVLTFSITKN